MEPLNHIEIKIPDNIGPQGRHLLQVPLENGGLQAVSVFSSHRLSLRFEGDNYILRHEIPEEAYQADIDIEDDKILPKIQTNHPLTLGDIEFSDDDDLSETQESQEPETSEESKQEPELMTLGDMKEKLLSDHSVLKELRDQDLDSEHFIGAKIDRTLGAVDVYMMDLHPEFKDPNNVIAVNIERENGKPQISQITFPNRDHNKEKSPHFYEGPEAETKYVRYFASAPKGFTQFPRPGLYFTDAEGNILNDHKRPLILEGDQFNFKLHKKLSAPESHEEEEVSASPVVSISTEAPGQDRITKLKEIKEDFLSEMFYSFGRGDENKEIREMEGISITLATPFGKALATMSEEEFNEEYLSEYPPDDQIYYSVYHGQIKILFPYREPIVLGESHSLENIKEKPVELIRPSEILISSTPLDEQAFGAELSRLADEYGLRLGTHQYSFGALVISELRELKDDKNTDGDRLDFLQILYSEYLEGVSSDGVYELLFEDLKRERPDIFTNPEARIKIYANGSVFIQNGEESIEILKPHQGINVDEEADEYYWSWLFGSQFFFKD